MDSVSIGYYLSGGIDVNYFKVAYLFLTLAFVTSKWIQFGLRDQISERTPVKASFKFWWRDNYNSVVLFFLMSFPLIVFSREFIEWLGLEVIHSDNPMWTYYFIGLTFGVIGEYVLKKAGLVRNASK